MNHIRMHRFLSGHLWLAALVIYLMAGGTYANDWPQYNGSAGNRTSTETIGQINWSQSAPPTPVWNVPLNKGFSSFSVVGGKAFTLVSRLDGSTLKEYCVALDASTGVEVWAMPMGPASYDSGAGTGDGPRSTPTCDGQRVYAFDAHLHLYCFNAANGSSLWDKNLLTEYAGRNISYQSAISPLLEGEAVVVAGGGAGQSALAFDRVDGHLLWSTLDEYITQATPVAATIQGVRQIIFLMRYRLVAVSVTDGTELWRYTVPYSTSTAASPVVWGNYVFCSASYGVGADVCQITKNGEQWTATQVWRKPNDLMNHWSTTVCHDGYLYGLFGAWDLGTTLKCVDLLTGQEKWSQAGLGYGGLMVVENKLVVLSDIGEIVVVEATPDSYQEITRAAMLTGKCWSSPILSDNRIYARSTTQGVCFELSELSLPLTCSIGATTITITNTGPVDYPVTFSEPVTGFDSADDIQVNAAGTAAAGLVAVVGGSGAGPYTVQLSALTGDGTLGITVNAGACSDASGTTNTMSAPSGTFAVDNTAPTAEISLTGSNPTNADTVSFAVNFSESVGASFDESDVVASGTLASGAVIGVTGGPQNYTVAATPADPNADGTLGIKIAPAGVNDLAGNVFAGGLSVFYTIDNTVPAVAISAPSVSLTHAGPVSYTLSFSLATFVSTNEDILSSITLNKTGTANGTVGVTGTGNLVRTVTVSGITGDGTLSITVERGTASNDMGVRAVGAGPSEAVTVRSVWPKAGVKYFPLDYK